MKKTLKVFLAMVMLISSMASMSVSAAWDGSAVNHPAYNSALGVFKGPAGAAINCFEPIAWGKEPGVATDEAIVKSSGTGANQGLIMDAQNTWWSQYQVEVPYTGLYIAKIKAAASSNPSYCNSAIEMVSETGSKATFAVKGYGWNVAKWSHEMGGDQYIYLPAGISTITLSCPAAKDNGVAFVACEFYAMNNKGANYVSESSYVEIDNSTRDDVILAPIGDYVGDDANVNDDGSITLPAGESVTLTTDESTPAGLYYIQVAAAENSANNFRVETGDGHYGVVDQCIDGLYSFNGDPANGDVEVVYLVAGENTITLTNSGTADANIEAIIFSSDYNGDYTEQMNILNCKMVKGITFYPESWNGAATAHPNYSGDLGSVDVATTLAADETATYTLADVPADGVYLVGATVATNDLAMLRVISDKLISGGKYYADFTIEDTTGEYLTTDGICGDQYIYLTAGTNEITVKNVGATDIEIDCLDFYILDGTVDYTAQCKTLNLAFALNYTAQMSDTNSPNNSTGSGWFLQYNGSYIQFSPNVGEAGIYEVELTYASPYAAAKGLEEQPFFLVDSSSGYCLFLPTESGIANDHWNWKNVSTDVYGNKAYMYLEEGINRIKITARHILGSSNASIDFVAINFKPVAKDSGITIDNCMKKTPDPIVVQAESAKTEQFNHDFYSYHYKDGVPVITNWGFDIDLTPGEWVRYTVNAEAAGNYTVSATATAYQTASTIVVETATGITEVTIPLTGARANATGGTVYLNEGENHIYVRNGGVGYFNLDSFTLTYPAIYPEVAATNSPQRIFIPGYNYIGAAADTSLVEGYSVRNYLNGITFNDGDVREYAVTIREDGNYSLLMTGTVPYSPFMKITLTDGTNTYTLHDGEIYYFGNHNTTATNLISDGKITLAAGNYTMKVEFTSNPDEGGIADNKTHVHGFEFTNYTDEDRVVEAFRTAATTADIEAAITKYARVLGSAGIAVDFPVAREYAMAYLLNNGKYVISFEEVEAIYEFAKNLITKEALGEEETLYTIRVSESVSADAQVIMAIYEKAVVVDEETGAVTAAPDKMTGVSIGEFFEGEDGYYYVECIVPNTVFTVDDNGNDSCAEKLMIWESFETLTPESISNF